MHLAKHTATIGATGSFRTPHPQSALDMLPRTLEPEVMDTPEEARDYDAMGHDEVNRVFVDDLLAALGERASESQEVLDVGTGTALIPLEFARRSTSARIVAVDLAEHMLALGLQHVEREGFADRITLERIDAKRLAYDDGRFDIVMSNSIVHHIPEPRHALAEMLRVLKPTGTLFVRDLLRPEDDATVEHLVATYAGKENADQQQLFRQSLHAALTVAEVRELLESLGVDPATCEQTTDRHWTITAGDAARTS